MRRLRPAPRLHVEALHVLVAGDAPGTLGVVREIVAAALEAPASRARADEWGVVLRFPFV